MAQRVDEALSLSKDVKTLIEVDLLRYLKPPTSWIASLIRPKLSRSHSAKVIDFEARTIPFNPWRSEGKMVYVSYIEFLLDTNAGSLLVDVYADEEDSPFISDVPIKTTTTTKAREWITMGVNQEANFLTFVFKQSSPSRQVRLTNTRIHARPGGISGA